MNETAAIARLISYGMATEYAAWQLVGTAKIRGTVKRYGLRVTCTAPGTFEVARVPTGWAW
jgi:hypothetical protein